MESRKSFDNNQKQNYIIYRSEMQTMKLENRYLISLVFYHHRILNEKLKIKQTFLLNTD